MDGHKMNIKDLSVVFGAVFIWRSSYLTSKFGVSDMPSTVFAALRSACVLPLLFFVKRPDIPWKHIIMLTITWKVVQGGVGTYAYKIGAISGLSAIIMQMSVFFQ
jgi:O-acetylserine/cysteine efflux transporter